MRLLRGERGYAEAALITSACEQCVTREAPPVSAIGLPLW
jgi:hypothetical protein